MDEKKILLKDLKDILINKVILQIFNKETEDFEELYRAEYEFSCEFKNIPANLWEMAVQNIYSQNDYTMVELY